MCPYLRQQLKHDSLRGHGMYITLISCHLQPMLLVPLFSATIPLVRAIIVTVILLFKKPVDFRLQHCFHSFSIRGCTPIASNVLLDFVPIHLVQHCLTCSLHFIGGEGDLIQRYCTRQERELGQRLLPDQRSRGEGLGLSVPSLRRLRVE